MIATDLGREGAAPAEAPASSRASRPRAIRIALALLAAIVVLAFAWWGYRSPDLFLEIVRLPFC